MVLIQTVNVSPHYVPYQVGWDMQRRIHAAVTAGTGEETVLLMEHEPVYTAGTRTENHERPQNGAPVVDVNRGGKITWHGPGQLVGYPIVRLPEPVDVVAHVRRIENMLIRALRSQGFDVHPVKGRSGVWVTHGNREEKVAAIGVRVEKGVTMHGFAVNCNNSLEAFEQIIPCGIADAGVTTLSRISGHDISPRELLPTIVEALSNEYAGAQL